MLPQVQYGVRAQYKCRASPVLVPVRLQPTNTISRGHEMWLHVVLFCLEAYLVDGKGSGGNDSAKKPSSRKKKSRKRKKKGSNLSPTEEGLLLLAALVVSLLYQAACYLWRRYQRAKFDRLLKEKVREIYPVIFQANSSQQTRNLPPSSVILLSSYQENGKMHSTRTELHFEDRSLQSKCYWHVSGKGDDDDGSFRILDGLLAQDGTAYWVEEQGKLRVLNFGTFDWRRMSFGGQWRAENGKRATYSAVEVVEQE